jgi:uncharacterized protein YndB with AHSA1/START domain
LFYRQSPITIPFVTIFIKKKMTSLPPLHIKTGLHITKPAGEVFEAIVDPEKMCCYFIAKGTGRLEEGATVEWTFPEMDVLFPVRVKKAEAKKLIQFSWHDRDGSESTVTITLKEVSEAVTFVEITEGEKEATAEGIRWLKSNTEGWANFLACLKAYLEYGINLRKGAFAPSQMPV